ncbi:TIGR01621 family pseudouridine synthase [Chitinibacter sp. SCUT-21]|uniref:TIGR01621 family pseudouridine synthase n=1 Tax=Chitinibacter sp. SCUT-21 TaxID=2970891 RepID=UPI0035A649B7
MTNLQNISIIAQTEQFLVINKPANLDFHHNDEQDSLVELLRQQTGLNELYPVHRLDKITSGLLIFARTADTARELAQLFAEHRIQKYYVALSDKKPSKKQGKIQGGMEKGRNGCWKLVREGGLLATTQFFSFGLGNGLRLFILKPLSGRTHQLRVAMKSLGSAILGDDRYGGGAADRAYLHAYAIEFSLGECNYAFYALPEIGIHFQSPAFSQALIAHKNPGELPWP